MPQFRLSDRRPVETPGRTISCCLCNKPILKWPDDEKRRAYLQKWKVHNECQTLVEKKLDVEAR